MTRVCHPHPDPSDRDTALSPIELDLLKTGLLPVDGDGPPLPVERVPRAPFCYVIAGRVLVPQAQVAEAGKVLGDAEPTDVGGGFFAFDVAGASTLDLLRRLGDAGVEASADHVLFSTKTKMHEGDDPEKADEPSMHAGVSVRDGSCARVVVIDTGLADEARRDPWFHDIAVADAELLRAPGHNEMGVGAGHGTFVTGVIRQVAWGCGVVVMRGLNVQGVAPETKVAAVVRQALALDPKPDLINLSLGGYSVDNKPMPALAAAVTDAITAGVVVVAAAGNQRNIEAGGTDDGTQPMWPAAIADVVAVAALVRSGDIEMDLTPGDQLAGYSNRFAGCDVAAPGFWRSVFVTGVENPLRETDGHPDRFDGAAQARGTSFACAAVTGAIARLMCEGDGRSANDAYNALVTRPGNITLHDQTMPTPIIAVDVWGD